jgi:radical SAM additional 4Fe4S-binding domain
MAEFKFHLRRHDGKPFCLLYSPQTSELLWEETGERVSLHSIGISYDLNPSRQWPVAKAVSPETPLGKSRALRALKIQLGLKCNGRCGYCNQTARPPESHGTLKDAKAFLDKLPSWLEPAGTDGLGSGLRIEYWGGEPLVYWRTMKYLAEALHQRYPKAVFNFVTNGTILDDEKIDWLDKYDFSVAVSHDGPGHKTNRGEDPFDDPFSAAALRKLYTRLRPKGLVSFNCVLAKNNPSLTTVREHIASRLGCSPDDLPLSTEELVLPYEDAGYQLSLHTDADHAFMRHSLYRDVTQGGALPTLNVKEKLEDFFRSIAQGRPFHTLGLRCGMDREDTLAVDLKGNVLTCQNTAASDGHKIGTVKDYANIRLNTAWHWSKREECPNCPVLQLCKGCCLRLEGNLWRKACDNSFTYNLALLAAGLWLLTGGVLTEIEGKVLRRHELPGIAPVVDSVWNG